MGAPHHPCGALSARRNFGMRPPPKVQVRFSPAADDALCRSLCCTVFRRFLYHGLNVLAFFHEFTLQRALFRLREASRFRMMVSPYGSGII